MNWDQMFSLTNAVAMIGWLILAVLPRRPLALSAVLYLGVGLLCLAYFLLIAGSLSGFIDSGRLPGTPEPNLLDYSIAGLRPLFMSDGGIVIGWTHYLAFDLFVGLWIARDADAKRVGRLAQLPFLFLTLMAGPIGLLAWLGIRGIVGRRGARADG
ncbi:MAG: ABA4-like family protein [Pseudomonadota bacterium]